MLIIKHLRTGSMPTDTSLNNIFKKIHIAAQDLSLKVYHILRNNNQVADLQANLAIRDKEGFTRIKGEVLFKPIPQSMRQQDREDQWQSSVRGNWGINVSINGIKWQIQSPVTSLKDGTKWRWWACLKYNTITPEYVLTFFPSRYITCIWSTKWHHLAS